MQLLEAIVSLLAGLLLHKPRKEKGAACAK
jgi:hypothetical protein